MTLGDVREVCRDWPTAPPLVFLVEGLVRGLGGMKSAPTEVETPAGPEVNLGQLAREAGAAVPILPRDFGLPKAKPVFDLEEMSRRSAALRAHSARMISSFNERVAAGGD